MNAVFGLVARLEMALIPLGVRFPAGGSLQIAAESPPPLDDDATVLVLERAPPGD